MVVEHVSTMMGYDLRDRRWIAYCPNYELNAQDLTLESSWERLLGMCNQWLEWCLKNGVADISPAATDTLAVFDNYTKERYAVAELADLSIQMDGWIVLDPTPNMWFPSITGLS